MATTVFRLKPEDAYLDDTNPPERRPITGRLVLSFDPSTDQTATWLRTVPQGLSGTLTAVVFYFMETGTTGSVRAEMKVEAITPADAVNQNSTEDFASTNSNGGTIPGTAGYLGTLSVTLTNGDSYAAGDQIRFRFNRDANGTTGTDDATGRMAVTAIEIQV